MYYALERLVDPFVRIRPNDALKETGKLAGLITTAESRFSAYCI